jgi:serine acetyltransferase
MFLPHPPGTTFCGRAGVGLTMYSIATCCPRAESSWGVENGPQLGDGVTVGAHAVLQGPIRVGDRSRIGFSVCVDRDVPAGVLVVSRTMRATLKAQSESCAD